MSTEKATEVPLLSVKATEKSTASSRSTAEHTDAERIDALAEAINRLVVYETNSRGDKFKIDFTSRIPKGKKKHGMNPAFLRKIADGLIPRHD